MILEARAVKLLGSTSPLSAAMLNIFINLLLVVHIVVCVLIVIAVLMQRPKNEGLGAAFGGGMTESLFGAQTTNVLATFTRWLGVLFFALTLLLSALYARQGRTTTNVQQKLKEAAKPVETPLNLNPAEAIPAPIEEKKIESPAPAPESPKSPESKPAVIPPVTPKAPELPPVETPKAPDVEAKPAPEKAPEAKSEAPKVEVEKEGAPILKVSAPELNSAVPPAPAPAAEVKPTEAGQ